MKQLLIRAKIRPYESLSSVVYRLTQANFYDHTGRIHRLIDLPQKSGRNKDALNDRIVIKQLAFINNCSENEIFNATVHRFTKYFSDGTFGENGSKAVKNFVVSSNTRYCPLCLEEFGYYKIYWELLPVSICTVHGVILNDVCPKCHRPVEVNWLLGGKCKCGGDLLSVDPVYVTSCSDVIRNQSFIQDRLEIHEPKNPEVAYWNYSPVTKLSAPDFFKLLNLFSALILNKLPSSSKFLKAPAELLDQMTMNNGISNLTNFIVMHSTVSILLDWPQKFYEFLEEYGTIDRSKRYDTGVQKYFGGIKESLLDKLDAEKFGFIHHAYAKYLNEQWTGGHLNDRIKVFNLPDSKKIHKKNISVDEAIDILGGKESFILKLIDQQIIHAVILTAKSKKKYLIDVESVYAFKKKRDRMLTCSDLARRLDINDTTVRSFVDNELLSPLKEPWCPAHTHLFEPEEVEKFEREFLSEERRHAVDETQEGYFSTAEAVRKIKISTARLLILARQGVFNILLCKGKKGLSKLLFSKNELKKYRDECAEKKTRNDAMSLHWASAIIGLDMRQMQHLIDTGLIKAIVKNINGKQTTYIHKKDLDEFKSEYAFIDEAAALMGFDTETVFQWIKQGRLKDYSQIPVTKRSSIRVLRREEIKPLFPENSMHVPQAAECLGLSPEYVHTLIRKNILPTLKGKGPGRTPFHRIPRQEVIRYREDYLKPVQENYVGVGQAAKYLGVGRSTIYRLRDKKILSTTKHKWKQTTLIPLQELVNYEKASREI